MQRFVIGVDVGTYSAKGVLVDEQGTIVTEHAVPYDLSIPRPGWAEHDADAVWWASVTTDHHHARCSLRRRCAPSRSRRSAPAPSA